VKQGYVLLNGCRSSLDQEIATAAHEWLSNNVGDPKAHIISYCLKTEKPIHTLGKVGYSALSDWQMNHSELKVPEQIKEADATIFVAGSEGTFWARNWAYFARKLILGIPRFGGAGEIIYQQELKRLKETSREAAEEYEMLNSLSDDSSALAHEVIRLAKRLAKPGNVFTIMSFDEKYIDVFDSYKQVCAEFEFEAERTDESTSLERIIPRIEAGIRNSAIVIADVSEMSPNVFYELGFAKALGKDVIVTAKRETPLPFDIGDVPVIFWESQRELKDELRKYFKSRSDT
jgi:hypothetical protein